MADPDLERLLTTLSAQQARLAQARPLPAATLKSLRDDFVLRFAHETTALEGNTLTLHETQVVLEYGMTIGGKTLREHLEVVNIRDAWTWLEGVVQRREPLSEPLIQSLHALVMRGLLGEEAGRYRQVPVFIRGSRHVPPNPLRVPDRMAAFVARFQQRPPDEHPIRFAARAHIELAAIHPFVDGNGRVCRLLVNLLLLRDGYPPALYTVTRRADYLRTLEEAQVAGHIDPFVAVTAQAVAWMMNRYLLALDQLEPRPPQPRQGPGLS